MTQTDGETERYKWHDEQQCDRETTNREMNRQKERQTERETETINLKLQWS